MMEENNIKGYPEQLGALLLKLGGRCVTAESCTGGAVSAAITGVPGASAWFDKGVVTYSNEAKMDLLEVPSECLSLYGAVSKPTAQAMAVGALSRLGGMLSLAVTGIAGPAGGSTEKPVGLVFLAVAYVNDNEEISVFVEEHRYSGDRLQIRTQAVRDVLKLACMSLLS